MMINRFQSLKLTVGAALLGAPLAVAAQTTPLRSYVTSGTEHVRSYDPAQGWTESFQTFTGTFELTTTTEARLTKVYADGSSSISDLILHWVVDLNAPAQSGTAVAVPDPNDPLIRRTTYGIGLQSDGVRDTMSATFTTRAYLSVIPGVYDWFIVAYGDFAGFVVSPLGNYDISGSETAGKTAVNYSGTFALQGTTSAVLTKVFADGTTTTVNLDLQAPVDLNASSQTLSATQLENQTNQSTTYVLDLQLIGTHYSVSSAYSTTQRKGKTFRTIATGLFAGGQP